MPQETLGCEDDKRLSPFSYHLPPQEMKILGWCCWLANLHVVFCLDRGGMAGADGPTHHGVFDLAYMRCIPNMIVSAPMNEEELRNVIRSGFYLNRSRVQNAEQGTEVLALLDKIAGQVEGLGRTLEEGTPGAVAEVQQALKNMRSEVLQERQRYAQWMNRAGK